MTFGDEQHAVCMRLTETVDPRLDFIEDPDSWSKASAGRFEVGAVIQISPQSLFGGAVASQAPSPAVMLHYILHSR